MRHSYLATAISAFLTACHFFLVKFTYSRVPDPYMDEIFHINQTREYCNGNWMYWNPLLTTPPGLYVFTPNWLCFGGERFVNSAFFGLLLLGAAAVRRKFVQTAGQIDVLATTLAVCLLPVLVDTSVLYYTDIGSLAFVVWGFALSNRYSWLPFGISLFFRQTNIVWAGLYVFCAWVRRFNPAKPLSSTWSVVWSHIAFVKLLLGFLAFVWYNQGIVLGDKTAHVPVFHAPQVLYLSAFMVFSSGPLVALTFFKTLRRHSIFTLLAGVLFLSPVFAYCASKFTVAHPYLLADNRHFTFYIWRRILDRHPLAPIAVVPVYVLSSLWIIAQLLASFNPVFVAGAVLASAATIVPAPLLEFRYFIVPYVLWRLSVRERRLSIVWLEVLWHLVINGVALYLFFEKPFRWASEPDAWQRFMW